MNSTGAVVWSPYLVGVGIGALSWLAFLLSDKPIGCSTAYTRTSGMIEQLFRGKRIREKPYYRKFNPTVDWEWMLVAGIVLGSFLSAITSRSLAPHWIPAAWAETFGTGFTTRWLVALAGGVMIGFGARWANGCTSGHGISGTLQLAVSSWVVFVCLFASGVATAIILFALVP